jgi:hypothetical protein
MQHSAAIVHGKPSPKQQCACDAALLFAHVPPLQHVL